MPDATPASPPQGEAQTISQRRLDGQGVRVADLAINVLVHNLLAGMLLALPCSAPAFAAPSEHALLERVQLQQTGRGQVGAGITQLSEQPVTYWYSGLIEFLSGVPPECRAVSDQQPNQECQKRERGVLEKFSHEHPMATNLIVAVITLVLGFWIGGGFSRSVDTKRAKGVRHAAAR